MKKVARIPLLSAFLGMLALSLVGFSNLPNPVIPSKKVIDKEKTAISARDTVKIEQPTPHPQLQASLYQMAVTGYNKLKSDNILTNHILAIVDFSKPSSEKRLFIIDMEQEKVIFHTLVAHGRNSGEKMATRFSNKDATHQSSLGFFITGDTYHGSNGYSMRLKGLEAGFNDKAERRAIVMHGASYVSEDVVKSTGRLGRSWGCPAVSQKENKQIIDLIKGGSCLFIYAPEKDYLTQSEYLKGIVDRSQLL